MKARGKQPEPGIEIDSEPRALRVKKIVNTMKRDFQYYAPTWADDAEAYFEEKFAEAVDETLKSEVPGDDFWARDGEAVLKLFLASGLICDARYRIAGKSQLLSKKDLIEVLKQVRAASCEAASVTGMWCRFLGSSSLASKKRARAVASSRLPKPGRKSPKK